MLVALDRFLIVPTPTICVSFVEHDIVKWLGVGGGRINNLKCDNQVPSLMIFVNLVYKEGEIEKSAWLTFLRLLYPFAPHICQELWSLSGRDSLLEQESWPVFDPQILKEEEKSFVIQVNGKLRGMITAPADTKEEALVKLAQTNEAVAKYLAGKKVIKTIFVEGRLLNLVVE